MKPRGLFVNTAKARCSIHESGLMVYNCLRNRPDWDLDYQELDFERRKLPIGYDFYLFNYHDMTSMSWLDTSCIPDLPGLKITIVLEVSPNNPFVHVMPTHFDAYMALDPTVALLNK